MLGTSTVIVAYTAIAGYQFRGAARLLNLVTQDLPGGLPQISVEQGRLIACVLVIVFTLLAGMVSIVSIDVFNGILMILGVLIALPLALSAVGGLGSGDGHRARDALRGLRRPRSGLGVRRLLPDLLPAARREQHVPEVLRGEGRGLGAPRGARAWWSAS